MTTSATDAQAAIQRLISAYDDAVHRRDARSWGQTWGEDAVWTMLGQTTRGRDNIVAAWQAAMAQFEYVGFFSSPSQIVIAGESATARVYTNEWLVDQQPETLHIIGVYLDRYQHEADRWLFAERTYHVLLQQRIAVTERTLVPGPE